MIQKFSKSELIAKRVLDECGLDDPTELPLKDIILGRKAYYEEAPLRGKEGEIITINDKSIITINSEIEYESKKRFAAAHELGHYEMHKNLAPIIFDTEDDLISWYKGGLQEIEANEFAAEFLMPSELFYNECKTKKFSPLIIDHLAERFKVSKTATILKFVKRGNHPVCIMYCKNNQMKWWKASQDFRYSVKFDFNKTPPTGSVAYEYFTQGKKYSTDQVEEIWKSDWFNLYRNERDTIFYEYCLYVKKYNYTISIIWED